MKKLIFPLLLVAAALACNKDKLLKDVKVYSGTDVLLNPMAIQILDANEANAPGLPAGLTVEIGGPGKDKIFSILGEKDIKLDGPMLNLGIRRVDVPTPEAPIWFTVTAKAPGYLNASALFSISDTSVFRVVPLPMISLTAPPEGVSIIETTFSMASATGAAAEINLASPAQNGVDQTTAVRIPAGTKMFAPGSQQSLGGSGKLTIVQFNPVAAGIFVPDGTILESNGKQKKPGTTVPASAFVVNIEVGGQTVETFSTPIEAFVEADNTIINPQTNALIAAGDSLPVWRYDDATAVWHEEKKTALTLAPGGKLAAKLSLDHLTLRNAGFFPPVDQVLQATPALGGGFVPGFVRPTATWTFNSTIPSDCPSFYYVEILRGNAILAKGQMPIYNGFQLKLGAILGGAPATVRLKIYEGSANAKGQLLFSQNLSTTGAQTVQLGAALPYDLTCKVDVSGTCDLNDQILPTVPVYFRESRPTNDLRGWKVLGYIVRGRGCTTRLVRGKGYDFFVPQIQASQNFTSPQINEKAIVIPAADADIPVQRDYDGDGVFEIDEVLKIRYNGSLLEFNYRDVRIPDDLCDELKKLLGQ